MPSQGFLRLLLLHALLIGGGLLGSPGLILAQPHIDAPPDLGTRSVGPLEVPIWASGGVPPYTWAVTAGALPPGTTLRTDTPPWFGGAPVGIIGVATTPGVYSFTLAVTDAGGQSATQAFTLTVTSLRLVDDWQLPPAFVDVPFAYTFTAAGGAGPLTFSPEPGHPLPPGFTLSPDGQLTGTPTTSGAFDLFVVVSDGAASVSRGFRLQVFDVQITSPAQLPNGQAGVPYAFTFTATSTAPSCCTWTADGLPGGFALDSAGTLQHPAPQPGTYQFTVTATDSLGRRHWRRVALAVVPTPPDLPTLNVQAPVEDFTVGDPYSLGLAARGGVPPYTWSAAGLPPGLRLRTADTGHPDIDGSSARISGSVVPVGRYTFTVSVTDSSPTPITVTRPVTLTVSDLGLAYVDFSGVTRGTPFTRTLRVLGGTGPYTATPASPEFPTGVTLTTVPPSLPTIGGTPLEWGWFHPLLTLTDAEGHTLQRRLHMSIDGAGATVTINTPNELPDATVGQAYAVGLSACCGATLVWTVEEGSALPSGLTLAPTGQLSGTPTSPSGPTPLSFRLRAADPLRPDDFAVREFRLNVTPLVVSTPHTLPFANHESFYRLALEVTGGAGSYTWSVAPTSLLPPGLALVSTAGTWTLEGTPTTAGRFWFSLVVTDEAGYRRTPNFMLDIYPPGQTPPVIITTGPDLGTWSERHVEIGLQATGGDGTYVWTLEPGSVLPPGLALRTDSAPWFGPETSAAIAGIATVPGVYSFTVRVSSAGHSATRTFTLTISPLHVRDPHRLPDAFVDTPYTYAFTTNSPGPVAWALQPNSPPLPSGLTLDPRGVLTGQPAPGTAGTYQFQVVVTDAEGHAAYHGFEIAVWDIRITCDAEIAPGLLQAVEGQAFAVQFTATPAGTYTWSARGLPQGLSLSPTGRLSGAPAQAGTFYLEVTATEDTTQRFHTARVALNVVGVPDILPELQWYELDDWTVGTRRSVAFRASGGRAPYTWSITNTPPGTTLRASALSPWTFPQQAELFGVIPSAGEYTFQITLTDSSTPPVSVTRSFTIRARELALTGPWSIPLTFEETHPGTQLRTVGGSLGYQYEVLSGKLPAGLTLSPTGFLSGTPRESGQTWTRLRIQDSAGHEFVTGFGVFVSAGPSATVQIDSHYERWATLNAPFSQTLTACCLPSYQWQLESGSTLPPGLTLSDTGVLAGTPTEAGVFSFRARVFDPAFPANFSVREFVLTVSPLVYSGNTTLPFLNVGQSASVPLAPVTGATGPVSWAVAPGGALPLGLSLAETEPGVWALIGTPTSAGQFHFTLQAGDTTGHAALVPFHVVIYPPGEKPPLNLPLSPRWGPVPVGRLHISLRAEHGEPPYTYSYAPGAQPIPGVRVQDDDQPQPQDAPPGSASLLGVVTSPGTYTTTVRVSDSAGAHIDRTVTVVVSALTITTSYSPPNAAVGTPYWYTLTATGNHAPLTWALAGGSALPTGLTLSPSGVISGTPAVAGTYQFTVVVSSADDSVARTLQLLVNPFVITTPAVLPIGTQGKSYEAIFAADGCPCTWSSVTGLPSGLTLSPEGVLSGTPTGFGTNTFTIRATGTASGLAVEKAFTLMTQSSTQQPLYFTTTATLPAATVGYEYRAALYPRGGVPPYGWDIAAGELPPGLSLLDGALVSNNSFAGLPYVAGVPMAIGSYTFTVRLIDAVGAVLEVPFSLVVSPLAQEYRALPLVSSTLRYGEYYEQQLLGIGGSGNYSWAAPSGFPPGLSLSSSGLIAGAPLNTGIFNVPVELTDTDTGQVLTWTVGLTIVSASGYTLTITNGPNLGTFSQGRVGTITLNASGGPSTPPRMYTFSVAFGSTLPAGFALVSGDALPGDAPAGATQLVFAALAPGTHVFTLEVRDQDGNFGAKTLSVTIARQTIFTNTVPDGAVGTTYTQRLHVWGGTPVWEIQPGSALPPGMALTPDGILTGTPTATGIYSFTLSACDAEVCVSRTYTLRVAGFAIVDDSMLPVAIVGTPYSHLLTATTSQVQFALSASSTLPSGLTLSQNGIISGTPRSSGRFTFTVVASDGQTQFSRTFTLFVRDAVPAVLSPPTTSGSDTRHLTLGQSFSLGLLPRYGVPPYTWSVAGGELPPGVALYAGDALPSGQTPGSTVIAGAPTTTGTYTVLLTATDGEGARTRHQLNLIVSPVALPISSLRSGIFATPYSQQLVATGGTPPYTFALVEDTTLPAGLSLSRTGLISGVPTDTGSRTFQVEVTDATGAKMRRSYTLFIASTATPGVPTLDLGVSGTISDTPVGTGLLVTLRTSGSTDTSNTWTLEPGSSLPPGIELLTGSAVPPGLPPGAAALSGAPTVPGRYSFAIRATNGSGHFGVRTFVLNVPPIQILSPATPLEATVGIPFTGSALTIAGGLAPFTITRAPLINNVPPPGLTLGPDGSLSGTPEVPGAFSVTLDVSDASGIRLRRSLPLYVAPAGGTLRLDVYTPFTLPNAGLGVPYSARLDAYAVFGTRPYTWTLDSGTLPEGLSIVPGDERNSAYLVGSPTTAGKYEFVLRVTDASGQVLTQSATMNVSLIALTPDVMPVGMVGTAYNATITPAGGSPPYTIELLPRSGVPPGLTVNIGPAGLTFSGTPTAQGRYWFAVRVADQAGNTRDRSYTINIDRATSPTPYLSLSPTTIQVSYTPGGSPPAPVPISISSSSTSIDFFAMARMIGDAPSVGLSLTTGSTPRTASLTFDAAELETLPPGTYRGILAVTSPQAVNVAAAIPVTLTVLPEPVCTYTLGGASATAPHTGGTGSFSLTTGPSCAWEAVSDAPWLTVTSPPGMGDGTVEYTVQPNPDPQQRPGTIRVLASEKTVATFTVTQFGTECSFVVSPTTISTGTGASSGFISVIASSASCTWAAHSSDESWLHVTSGMEGVGSGQVGFSIDATTSPSPRSAEVALQDGTSVTVTQAGLGCGVTLSASGTSVPASGGSGSVAVTMAPCGYTTTAPPAVTITSGAAGSGPGTVEFTVAANPTTSPRTLTLQIGGLPFVIEQAGIACAVALTGPGSMLPAAGGTSSIDVGTTASTCDWTAASGASWLIITSGVTGAGSGTVTFQVAPNLGVVPRSTTVTVGGQSVQITQAGTECTFALRTTSASVPVGGGTGSVAVVASEGCAWSSSSNASWLHITFSANTGSGSVAYLAEPNPTSSPRTGTLAIAGVTFTVSQAGVPCVVTLSSTATMVSAEGGTGWFSYSTSPSGCSAAVQSFSTWITAQTSVPGTVQLTVLPNPFGSSRVGRVLVGDQVFTITQLAASCSYSLHAPSATFTYLGGSAMLLASANATGCWPAVGSSPEIALGSLSFANNIFTQPYTVNPFISPVVWVRLLNINFGGVTFVVKQTSW